MLLFLSSFTEPFLMALLFWPVLALLLTVPILAIQYRRYGKVSIDRGVVAYITILYALSLVSFTLYPMPSNPLEFCRDYSLSPQLIPFSFIPDIQSDGLRAMLQASMNLLFFVPLGILSKLFFNLRLRTTLLLAFLVSAFIEIAQLTGAFGYYPCSYRLFDIDDLIINVTGGVIGYSLANLIPHHEIERANKNTFIKKPGLLRYIIGLILDQALAYFTTITILLVVYFSFGSEVAIAIRDVCFFFVSLVVLNAVPLLAKGWSAGSWIVRFNHDDHRRTKVRRTIFYLGRAVILMLILFPPLNNGIISSVTIGALLIVWWRQKKLIYQYL